MAVFDAAEYEAYKKGRAASAASGNAAPSGDATPSKPDRGALDAGARGLASGATANFNDEIRGLVEASGANPDDPASLGALIHGALKYWGGDKGAKDRYDTAVARERDLTKTAEEQHPIASTAGNVAGAMMMPVGGEAVAATRAGRIMEGAAQGGLYGAVAGAGEGEGLQDTINRAASGGATGAVLGGAAAPVIEGLGNVGSAITNKVNVALGRNPGGDRAAAQRIMEARAADETAGVNMAGSGGRAGMSQAEADTARAAGAPIIEGDIGGENVRNLARQSTNMSGEAKQALDDAIGPRYQAQSQRTSDFLKNEFDYPDTVGQLDRLKEAARRSNKPAYDAAFNHPDAQAIWSPELEQFSGSPVVQGAIRNANLTARHEGAMAGYEPIQNPFQTQPNGQLGLRPPDSATGQQAVPNLQFWDAVKRNLDKGGAEGQQAARALRQHLDSIVPQYADARGTAAKFFDAADAHEAGGNFARMSGLDASNIGQARQAINGMNPAEKKLFQQNFVAHVIAKVENQGDNQDITNKIYNSKFARDQIQMALGPDKANKLEAHLATERAMDKLRGAVTGNSTTARQLAEMAKMGIGGVGSATAYGLATGDTSPGDLLTAGFAGSLLRKGYHAQQIKREVDISKRVGQLLASDNPNAVKLASTAVAKYPTLRNYFLNFEMPAASRGAASLAPSVPVGGVSRAEDQPNAPRPANQ